MRYAQTRVFTTLMLFQMFNLFNSRSDEQSAFPPVQKPLAVASCGNVVRVAGCVVHVPVMQQAFSTVGLNDDVVLCEMSPVRCYGSEKRAN